ncbi:MAG TPA: hypothetical protein VHC47_03360, partial [Mucilaginibacter sp.]|nr:hypothetical protein [Mucilaginibacter sp.]
SRLTSQTVEVIYENADAIFIRKGNALQQVNSKGSVLKLFKDKTRQLKQYLSANKIKYRKDREGAIVKLAAYYDQITR